MAQYNYMRSDDESSWKEQSSHTNAATYTFFIRNLPKDLHAIL